MPFAVIYGAEEDAFGSIVAFNLKNDSGDLLSYAEIDAMCASADIQIRAGSFCNPGAAQKYLGLTTDDIRLFAVGCLVTAKNNNCSGAEKSVGTTRR
jgi:selenocysteine lyase/cysteine desulfurase